MIETIEAIERIGCSSHEGRVLSRALRLLVIKRLAEH